jgi:Xaa-Pro aminopeptidase
MKMTAAVETNELAERLAALRHNLDQTDPEWELAIVMSNVNQYYLTGTMQNGALVIPRDGQATYWVRRNYARACRESGFPDIRPMRSFADVAATLPPGPKVLYLEKESVPMAQIERLTKHVPARRLAALELVLAPLRAVKSPWELARMREAGHIHQHVQEDLVPGMLREGISEVELAAEIMAAMMREGHEGVTRVSGFNSELFLGNVCFGETNLHPSAFDSPDGVLGFSPGVPLCGNRHRLLKPGDLVLVDTGCCVQGYHTDKTMIYAFGHEPAPAVLAAHQRCVDIQNEVAAKLVPGAIPSQIFQETMIALDDEFLRGFMGGKDQQVRFLGHGIGLYIDEYPVVAAKFDQPLQANTTIALEPKQAIPGVGLVGTENTFVVTEAGGVSLTGGNVNLIRVAGGARRD